MLKEQLKFLLESAIINLQRAAFLRKSGCRNAARLFAEMGKSSSANRVAEMRKSGFGGLTHFLFLKSPHLKDLFCKQIMIEKNKTTATEIERFQWLWSVLTKKMRNS